VILGGVTLRPATDADRDAVLALGVTEETVWFGAPEVDADEVGEWVDDEGGVASGVVALDEQGAVSGFAAPGRDQAVFMADPARTDEVADALVTWLVEQRDTVELLTFAGDAARVAAFERHGMHHDHSMFTLSRPADAGPLPTADFPEGVSVAPYILGDDDHGVHHLIYVDAAWASVPGHIGRDHERWLSAVQTSPVRFVARRDGRLVGWLSGRLMANGRGWVDQLAVAQNERGRGLGRAMLLHAFAALDEQGANGHALGVQARNDAALGLYRSIGLEVEREWRVYAVSTSGRRP
jgi:ribosomal protein S18 acetylase RimI-like enzyme